MKCEKAQQLISLWLDGMLGNEDEQALMAHIENCRHCRRVWRDWEQIRFALRSYPSATLSPEFDRKILSRLKAKKAPVPPLASHWLSHPAFRLASSAMCGLFVMALTLLMLMLPAEKSTSQPERFSRWQWHGLGREVVQLLEEIEGRERRWQGAPSSSSSHLPSRSYCC